LLNSLWNWMSKVLGGGWGGVCVCCPPIQKEEVKGPKTMNSKNSLPPIKAFCPSPLKQKQYQPSQHGGQPGYCPGSWSKKMVSFHLFGNWLLIEMSCSLYLIDNCPSEIHTSNISMKYHSTLAAWTLMMLFSEMLKFLNFFFFFSMNKTLWRKILNLHGILCFLKKNYLIDIYWIFQGITIVMNCC